MIVKLGCFSKTQKENDISFCFQSISIIDINFTLEKCTLITNKIIFSLKKLEMFR